MAEKQMDKKVLVVGLIFGLIFALGIVRMMIAGTDGLWAVVIGLIGIIGVYFYDKKKTENPWSIIFLICAAAFQLNDPSTFSKCQIL